MQTSRRRPEQRPLCILQRPHAFSGGRLHAERRSPIEGTLDRHAFSHGELALSRVVTSARGPVLYLDFWNYPDRGGAGAVGLQAWAEWILAVPLPVRSL